MSDGLSYAVGSHVAVNDRTGTIARHIDVDMVLVQFKDDGATEVVNVSNLQAPDSSQVSKRTKALDAVPEEDMDIARERFAAIEPLLKDPPRRQEVMRRQAKKFGASVRSLQRWVKAYSDRFLLSDLAPGRRGKRDNRLSKKFEAIIADAIETLDLTKQRRTQKKVIEAIQQRCKAACPRLKPPHDNTIRKRIKAVSAEERMRRRHGAKAARDKYGVIKGSFPGADHPLSVVQIDHTKLDIILLDDEERLSIGRPWLTLAIDVFSRMVVGIHLSLDAPSALSVGLCLQQAILPKEKYLAELGLKGSWPVWGLMRTIHADNGKDFHSRTLLKACEEYGINIEWRPVKRPEFGGHIESMMGTVAKEIHALPGTTFSNVKERGEYKSEKEAKMTFHALERFLVSFITEEYHQRVHRTIGMPPLEKWREGLRKKGGGGKLELNDCVADPERLRIAFLPYTERTVQRDGVSWDGLRYYHNRIRNLVDLEQGGRKVKFLVKRDPRDISTIFLFDPLAKEYVEVPTRHDSIPQISIWEYRAIERDFKQRGMESVNMEAILAGRQFRDSIVEEEKIKTVKTRREKQRDKLHAAARGKAELKRPVINDNDAAPLPSKKFVLNDDDYQPQWEDL